ALSYYSLRRYPDTAAVLDRAVAIKPDDTETKVTRALLELDWKADSRPLHEAIDSILAENPAEIKSVVDNWLTCALAERDAAAAASAVMANSEGHFGNDAIHLNRQWIEGVIARMTKDDAKAQAAFTAARIEQENIVQAQPNYAPALCVLGLIDAGLGRKEDALREGRRAIGLLPVEKDSVNGPHL